MAPRSKWMAVVCLVSVVLCAAACSDDDDDMTAQQVSETQAEIVVAAVVPDILDLSLGVLALVQAAAPVAPPLAASIQGAACSPIPGVSTEFFCTVPTTGVICPINATTSEWQFNDCDADGSTVDGTVTVVGAGPFLLTFNLTVDGQDVTGDLTITLGATCDTLAYDDLVLRESGVSATLVGTLQDCASVPGGEIDATINASGLRPFIANITVNTGFATIFVIDAATQETLYVCTWNPTTPDTAECVPYTIPG